MTAIKGIVEDTFPRRPEMIEVRYSYLFVILLLSGK